MYLTKNKRISAFQDHEPILELCTICTGTSKKHAIGASACIECGRITVNGQDLCDILKLPLTEIERIPGIILLETEQELVTKLEGIHE